MSERKPLGGQALIEGVMIKAPDKVAMAARAPDGSIVSKCEDHVSLSQKYRILSFPFLRGIVVLFEMLVIGIKAITWSANQQGEEEELGPFEWFLTFSFAIALTIFLFVLAPYYVSRLFFEQNTFAFAALDGALRLVVFLLYLALIGLMSDVRRMFEYHGAEHMAVHCYESGEKLTIKNVAKYPPEHPRCGTNLLFIVVMVSILLFSFIRFDHWYYNALARILLIPAVAGISYEILKFSSKYRWLSWLAKPGIWVQKLTTRKPAGDQIEVAIRAVERAR
ncbi:DUF1385 domain-containing protein [Candidatus Woesearchaeota archaeon]|nr:MAG: DUF1385 domain-containing protein [Candidatus Woesearchaeota archaeon]